MLNKETVINYKTPEDLSQAFIFTDEALSKTLRCIANLKASGKSDLKGIRHLTIAAELIETAQLRINEYILRHKNSFSTEGVTNDGN